MIISQAYKLLIKKYPLYEVLGAYESDDCFLFKVVPMSFNKKAGTNNEFLVSGFLVKKTTHNIIKFDPIKHNIGAFMPIEEYGNGKIIKDFK